MKSMMDMYKGKPGAASGSSHKGTTSSPKGMMNESPKGKAVASVGLAANCEMDNMIVRMGSSKGM